MLTALTSEEEARFPGMASSETEKLEVKTKKVFLVPEKFGSNQPNALTKAWFFIKPWLSLILFLVLALTNINGALENSFKNSTKPF